MGQDSGNGLIPNHGDLPWLQDIDANNNLVSDVWYDQWGITYRDVVILDSDNVPYDIDPTQAGIQNFNLSIYNLAVPENYAALREFFLRAASPKAGLSLKVVDVPTSVNSVGESNLPAGDTWVDEWGSFYVEVWVETTNDNSLGLTDVALDLTYDGSMVHAESIEYGPAFTINRTGTILNPSGRISNLGGATLRSDIADNAPALLARIKFNTVTAPHNANGEHIHAHAQLAFGMADAEVGSVISQSAIASMAGANVSLMPVTYDLNDDDRIGFADLAVFTGAFLQNVGGTSDAWAADFDGSGRVDFGDLSWFTANFLRTSADTTALDYPTNWPNMGG
ncbi:MAG: hypothetical protein KDA42_14655, partial [Planctomycetales bacterium]|nr:hypothetical protein [Planctomycetales bacterium]